MASIRIGGDPESYMEAPQMQISDEKGGLGFIAGLFNLLGIGEAVGKVIGGGSETPDPLKFAEPEYQENSPKESTPMLPALDQAAEALQPPQNMSWSDLYLPTPKSKLKVIDPNSVL
jgi:hypothetical protein